MNTEYVDAHGVSTYVTRVGEGPALLLLHGAALAVDGHLTWFRTMAALADRFQCITFDQLGFGRTDLPPDRRYRNRLERVDHAWATIDALELDTMIVVGHSEGGFMAARMAITAPERIRGMVIVNSGGTAPYLGGGRDDPWIDAAKAAYNDETRFDSEDRFVRTSDRLNRGADPEYEAILRDNYRRAMRTGQDQLLTRLPEQESDYYRYGELQNRYVLPYLQQCLVPTLLMWATDDATVPVARGLKLLSLIPNAEMHVFQHAGHDVMHDQAGPFNRELKNWCSWL